MHPHRSVKIENLYPNLKYFIPLLTKLKLIKRSDDERRERLVLKYGGLTCMKHIDKNMNDFIGNDLE